MKHLLSIVISGLIILTCINYSATGQEQQRRLIDATGILVDQDGYPVSGATIYASGGAEVVHSGPDGRFIVQTRANTLILVEAKGYASKRVAVIVPELGEIMLEKLPFQLTEGDDVNLPFGTLKKRHMVGSVTVIDPSELLGHDARTSVAGALTGRVPGLFGGTNVFGIGAVTVVDGIPRPLGFISLHEVEQITVIKDASSRLLYGAQAEQPVILVTTKRGVPFKRRINAYAESGLLNPISYPSYLDAATYMELYNEARTNDGLPLRYTPTQIENTRNRINPVLFPDEDYYNDTYLRNFKQYSNVVTELSGGNEAAQYFAFLGWSRQNSLIALGRDQSINRINLRGNVDYDINSFMTMRFDGITVFDISNQAPRVDFWNLSTTLRPDLFPMLIPVSEIDDQEALAGSRPIDGEFLLGGTSEYQTNMYGELTRGGYRNTLARILQFNTGLDVDLRSIAEGLTASTYLTFDIYNMFNTQLNDQYAVYQPRLLSGMTGDSLSVTRIGQDTRAGNEVVTDPDFYRRIGLYGTINYKKTFDDHAIDITGLAYRDMVQLSGVTFREKNLHFGLRANYNFQNKYIAELGGVLAGSPRFAPENRYAFSPSAGFAWVISEEEFFTNNPFLDFLKVRVSWANIHTDAGVADYYLYQTSYNQRWWFDYNHGIVRNRVRDVIALGNEDITWSNREKYSIGFESSLLNNLLWIEGGYFYSTFSNVITRRNNFYPDFFAGVIPYENYNRYEDKGFEGGLRVNYNRGDWGVSAGSNFIYAEPKVLQIDEPTYEWDYRQRVNQPTDAIFGYVALGLFNSQSEIEQHAVQTFGTVRPGDIKYKDLNGDGIIDENDQKIIGNFRSRFQYSLNLNISYRSFELFMLGTGQTGGNNHYNNPYYWVFGERKYSETALNRWTPETASTATYPALTTGSGANNFRTSTFWLEEDIFFTLNAAQLTYNVPRRLTTRISMNNLKVYVRGSNLLMLSDIKDKKQLNIGSEPQFRTFAIGVNAHF
jgi:TonB-linked SusC/RagA family outer membrane protein